MHSLNGIFSFFSKKAKKIVTYDFWRKRLTLNFWRDRFTLKFWNYHFRLWMDELSGLDFMDVITSDELGLDPESMYDTAPSGNKYLRKVLKDLSIKSNDLIIDIGSGKGSAMRIMLEFPFFRVDGVEISSYVVEIAKKNFERLNVSADRYRIFQADATKFKEFDLYNYFYFYNPFSVDIMRDVIDNIIVSTNRKPRQIFIIYTNPKYDRVILSTGKFCEIGDYPGEHGHRILLYSNMKSDPILP